MLQRLQNQKEKITNLIHCVHLWLIQTNCSNKTNLVGYTMLHDLHLAQQLNNRDLKIYCIGFNAASIAAQAASDVKIKIRRSI